MKTTKTALLNETQKRALQGFFAWVRGAKKYGDKIDLSAWAEVLDYNNIGWNLQNAVACLAETDFYLDFKKLSSFDR